MLRRRLLVGMGALLPLQGMSEDAAAPLVLEDRRHRDRRWTCCRVNPGLHSLGLFHAGPDANPLRNFRALELYAASQGRRVLLAMNAGMFEADGSPVGWCVAEGRTLKGPNVAEGEGNFFLKPNGVFALQDGKALVLETASAAKRLTAATFITQSGPLLVDRGSIHPAFREGSSNRLIRNGVGVAADGGVWLAISEDPVSFHESATLFREVLGCPNALFLDGVISRLHAPSLGRTSGAAMLGPLLAVTVPV